MKIPDGFQPPYKIDLGCGPVKKPGYIGVDHSQWEGVDIVHDFEKEPLPFPDGSVSHVFSAHCLEHLSQPLRLFQEAGRVLADRGQLEIWTPYGFSNSAFIFGHVHFLTEEQYAQMCIHVPDTWKNFTGQFWTWDQVTYNVTEQTRRDMERAGVPLDFAVRYYKNVVEEWGVNITVWKSAKPKASWPERRFCHDRSGPFFRLDEFAEFPSKPARLLWKAFRQRLLS